LYDRLGWHGLIGYAGQPIYAVRDWILCMIGSFHWPNFNIADSLLVCSVIVLLLRECLMPESQLNGEPKVAELSKEHGEIPKEQSEGKA